MSVCATRVTGLSAQRGRSIRQAREERIAEVVARQHGVITRRQLVELGVSAAAIGRRLKSGRLRAVHRGIYTVGPIVPEWAAEMAAVLAGGPGAVLSHTNALRLWGLSAHDPGHPIHVITPGTGRRGRPGIAFHRVRSLPADERTVHEGVPVTSPVRTLIDAAALVGSREIEQALAAAERERLIRADELIRLLERYSRRPGVAILRVLLDEQESVRFTRSEAERRCLDLFRAAALPRPHTNVPVGPYELDLFWPHHGVAVEVDGHAYHSSRARFEGDRRKDAWLQARGIKVIRLTWRQITRNGVATAVQIGQALALAHADPQRDALR